MAKTDEEQLRWALSFAQADLSTWRDGDWLNALEDLHRLVVPREGERRFRESETALAVGHLFPLDRKGRPARPDPAHIKEWLVPLQQALRGLLSRLLRGRRSAQTMNPVAVEEGEPGEPFMMPVKIPFTGEAILEAAPPFNRLQMYYVPKLPNPQERFVTGTVLRLADLLTRVNLDRLKACPECKRLFLAVRRQRFDTPQCSLRDRVRRFREKGMRRAKKGTRR
jgi:hypothetical protein